MSVGRPVATVGGFTFASRILGLIRDVAFAAILGAGPVAEAFFVAFRLPNLFRRLFAEGAFSVAFVPLFTRKLNAEGAEAAREFAENAMSVLAAVLLVLTLVAQVTMPWFIYAVAWGFADRPEVFDQAVVFSRIAFPYLLFISLVALFAGVLNALERFAVAAAAPIALNILLIGGLLLAEPLGWAPGYAVAWAVPVAGIAQLLMVAVAARQAGMRLRVRRPRLTPDTKRMLTVATPAALASGVYQINLLVGTLIASFFPGAVAWLQYADRIYQLPLGVVGIALSVVLLPELSRRLATGDAERARNSFSRSIEIALALAVPSAIGLLIIPDVIILVLFQHGAFTASDTEATALAVLLFGLGLPAFMVGKVYSSAFFAREDTRRPLRYATIAFTLNTILAAAGAVVWGFLAIPVATSLSAWLLVWLLARASRDMPETKFDEGLRRRLPRLILASVVMGVAVLLVRLLMLDTIAHVWWRYPALAALVIVGVVVYGGVGLASGAFDLKLMRSAFTRSGGNGREAAASGTDSQAPGS